jgi:hypothetical protein
MALFGLHVFSSTAQVKIGDNPSTLDSNAILEMESTDKGVLVPRVALNDLSQPAPLSGTVTEGMLIYSDGGTVSDGFYFWNGSAWVNITHGVEQRDNFVLVKSASDFPAPSAGVITLAPNSVYEVNGVVVLSDKIDLNGSYLIGQNANADQLIYTGSGEFFTGNASGTIKILTLVATTGQLFNIDATSNPGASIVIRDCIIANSPNVGFIRGYNLVFNDVISYSGNTTGIIYENIGSLLINNTAWFSNNSGTFETFQGNFTTIAKIGGIMQVPSGRIGVDIVNVNTVSGAAEVVNTVFSGAGTYINGAPSNAWSIDAGGVETVSDYEANGVLYITSSTTTTIGSINTPVKIAGTTTAVNLDRMTSPANNRLTYTGSKTRKFEVTASISFTTSSNNQNISFYVAINGVVQAQTRQQRKTGSSGDIGALALSGIIELSTNDYVEVWVENNSGSANITAEFMNLAVK